MYKNMINFFSYYLNCLVFDQHAN